MWKKGTIVTYIELKSKDSGICEVKYQGKSYMIKQVNLVTALEDEEDTGGIGYDEEIKEENPTSDTSNEYIPSDSFCKSFEFPVLKYSTVLLPYIHFT